MSNAQLLIWEFRRSSLIHILTIPLNLFDSSDPQVCSRTVAQSGGANSKITTIFLWTASTIDFSKNLVSIVNELQLWRWQSHATNLSLHRISWRLLAKELFIVCVFHFLHWPHQVRQRPISARSAQVIYCDELDNNGTGAACVNELEKRTISYHGRAYHPMIAIHISLHSWIRSLSPPLRTPPRWPGFIFLPLQKPVCSSLLIRS